MIGGVGPAFHKITLLSWYIYIVGAFCADSFATAAAGHPAGHFYTPPQQRLFEFRRQSAVIGIYQRFSSILKRINFIVTIQHHASPA